MMLILAIIVAMIVLYVLSRRNRECRILSRILFSKSYERACRLHREAMARFGNEQEHGEQYDMPPAPTHEAVGETILLKMCVESVSAVGMVEVRCCNRSDGLSYWTGQFALPADSTTEYSRLQEVQVEGVVTQVDRQLGSITLMPTSVDAEPVGKIVLALR